MDLSSLPPYPSSFDPALHLHSEQEPSLPAGAHSDEFEAFNTERQDRIRELTKKGVVIQHRSWQLNEVFRTDEDIRPETPSKPPKSSCNNTKPSIPSSPPSLTKMASSSPPMAEQPKRKLGYNPDTTTGSKRSKMIGPFLEDDDEPELGFSNYTKKKHSFSLSENALNSQDIYDSLSQQSNAIPRLETIPSMLGVHAPVSAGQNMATRIPGHYFIRTCSGKSISTRTRKTNSAVSYEQMIASRSTTAPGRAKKSYYGIDIHDLLDVAAHEVELENIERQQSSIRESVEKPVDEPTGSTVLWTEKYRARKFSELVGDERTHRLVLRWMKAWDPIVFPGLAKRNTKRRAANDFEERIHRKILLLTGPPGLGKTTLAHVCAKQAGYEVIEINASDDRNQNVVKGRIREAVGTENVKSIAVDSNGKRSGKTNRPVCVVVDEVDGVVSGSGGGEGGFIKALVDLVLLDQKNSKAHTLGPSATKRSKKGGNFRLLRPLILICNDVYHPSLRPLRASSIAEIIHVRQAPLEKVVQRMKQVFEKERIRCEPDGIRRLCEASWGLTGSRNKTYNSRGTGEGDIRGVLLAGEFMAQKLRSSILPSSSTLTKKWVEQHVLSDSSRSSHFGRGGQKEIVDRVFLDGAGFPADEKLSEDFTDPYMIGPKVSIGVTDLQKRSAMNKLREMVDTAGDYDRCISGCFSAYPTKTYQDDTFLSKPNAAYEWLGFHDMISSKVFSNQDWELNPYMSQSILAFHFLFASSYRDNWDSDRNREGDEEDEHPFSGPRADFAAYEAEKQNRAVVNEFQSSFSAPILRIFSSTDSVVTELIPCLVRMLSPDVKPTVVGAGGGKAGVASVRKESERALVRSAVRVMDGMGIMFEKARVETESGGYGGWIYRMEPPLDALISFSKIKGTRMDFTTSSAPVRYAVRQVLDQEYQKEQLQRRSAAGQAKLSTSGQKPSAPTHHGHSNRPASPSGTEDALAARLSAPKRDFFGRIVANNEPDPGVRRGDKEQMKPQNKGLQHPWVSFHEGASNAVRRRITMDELLLGL